MATNMELTKDGELKIAGSINTRLPVVTDGLVAHFPFDGRGGAFDGISGIQTAQNIETGVNLIEAMHLDWRDPESWASNTGMTWDEGKQALRIEGYHNSWLKTPIIVDATKTYHVSIEVMEEVQSGTGLYLGGLCNNAAGERVTPNYDYSYAANAQPATGVWTQYCTTRAGTGAIVSRTSQSFANISGWTGTRVGITDLLTKYYYYGGLFNYSTGGVMYIKNLSIVIVDNDTSNCTPLDNGIAVEEATNNVITNTNLNTGWSQGYQTNIVFNEISPPYGVNSPVVGFDRGNTSNYWYSYGDYAPQVAGTTYTVSLYVKTLDPAFSIKFYTADNAEVGRYNSEYIPVPNDGEWHRVVWSSFVNPIDSQSNSLSFNFIMGEAIGSPLSRTWFCAPQMEAKKFATSFTSGSRATPSLYLDNIGGYTEYSIYGNFIPTLPFSNAVPAYNEGQIGSSFLWAIYDTLNTGYIAFRYYESGSNSAPYLNRSGTYLTGNMHSYYELAANQPASFVITKTGTTFTLRIYQNGYKGQHVATVDAIARLDNLRLGIAPVFGAIYSNLSIYNRELTNDEIIKLNDKFSEIKPTGDIAASSISSTLDLPSDVNYFSLGTSGISKIGLNPTTEVGTTYSEGSVWIGDSTVNMFTSNQSNLIGATMHSADQISTRDTDVTLFSSDSLKIVSTVNGGSNKGAYCYVSGLTVGVTYTYSIYIYPTSIVTYGYFGPNAFSWTPTESMLNNWNRVSRSFVAGSATSQLIYFALTTSATTFYLTNAQIEARDFITPFINGARGASAIRYHGNIIDLNQGTVGCWFYPTEGFFNVASWNRVFGHSTAGNVNELQVKRNSTGTNLVMSISNAAGAPQTTWSSCPSVTITPYKWYFVVARWDITAGTMSLTVDGVKNEQAWTATYQPTAYGDFTIGYHPNYARPSNSYFKDLFIAKRALTDTELDEIYNTKMVMTADGTIQVQDSIKTGQVI